MVISPNDLNAQRDEKVKEFNKMVTDCEKDIDSKLMIIAPEPGRKVSIELPESVSGEVIAKLMAIYSETGWEVTYPTQSRSGPRILAFEYLKLTDLLKKT